MTLQHISNTNYWKLSWLQKPEKLIERTINYCDAKPFLTFLNTVLDRFESGNKLQELETNKSDSSTQNQGALIRSLIR